MVSFSTLKASILSALLIAPLSSCAAMLETEQRALVEGQRVLPPTGDKNRVYVEFSEQTGEGGDFEDRAYEALCAEVVERGYALASYDEADYVLWATLRCFERVGTEEGNKTLAALGGIAGGVAVGVAVHEATENPSVSLTGGFVANWFFTWLIEKLTQAEHWAMVLDVQLARRLDEEARSTIRIEDQHKIRNATVSSAAYGIVSSTEAAAGGQSVTKTTEITLPTVFLELEQRVVAEAKARRKSKPEVADALLERLVSGLASQLPKNRSLGLACKAQPTND